MINKRIVVNNSLIMTIGEIKGDCPVFGTITGHKGLHMLMGIHALFPYIQRSTARFLESTQSALQDLPRGIGRGSGT